MEKSIRDRIVRELAEELKTSSFRGSDADWYIGFNPNDELANESEYDPKTGKIINNTEIGDHATYLQQWDASTSGGGFLEEDDIEDRDSGTYSFRLQNI